MSSRAAKTAETRRPGRPPADGTDQRERLLDAAIQSFSEDGIAATTLRGLARANGVTPAMLHYYFGSKDRLVEAVIGERLAPAINEINASLPDRDDDDVMALIRAFVSATHKALERHPWLPGLWVREVLANSSRVRDAFVSRAGPELSLPLSRRLADAQAAGKLNPALDPRLLFVSLIGLTVLPFAAEPIWRRVFEADDIDTEQMLNHTLALLSDGIERR